MPEPIPVPAYRIHTPRLVMRCWQPAEAPLMQAAITESLEHLLPWMTWAHREPETLQRKVELLRRFRGMFGLGQDYHYGVFSRDESPALGSTGLHTRREQGVRESGYGVKALKRRLQT